MHFKNLITYLLISGCIFLLSSKLHAQDFSEMSQNSDIESIIEILAERSDAELDYSSFVERMIELSQDPVNINKASEADLSELVFLTDFQVFNLLNYRKNVATIHSPYELQFLYGFDKELVRLMMPFVSFETGAAGVKEFPLKNAFKYGRHDLFLRHERVLEEQKGYREIPDSILAENPDKSRYLGSPDKLYLRYKYYYKNKLSIGLTAEKDAGEEFFTGSNPYGFDYYAGHVQIQDVGVIKTLNVGDYSVQFGQGLVAWSSMSFGKTPYVMNVIRKGRGIYRYTSSNENQFMRGGGTTIRLGAFDISAFYSNKSIDANIDLQDTITNSIESVTSFQNVGYHRTPNEIADKNAINEQIAGGNVKYSHKNLRLGMTYAFYKYNADLLTGDQPYELFRFSGNSFMNLGADFRYQYRKYALFGEVATNDVYEPAVVGGFVFNAVPQVAFSGVYRNISPGYYAGYASAFGEQSTLGNEKGFYLGAEVNPAADWTLHCYMDMFRFPWMRYNAGSPSNGYDWLAQIDYEMSRAVSMYVRMKGQEKEENLSIDDTDLSLMLPEKQLKARYSLKIEPDDQLRLKSQVEYAGFQANDAETMEHGWVLSQDVIWQLQKMPLRFVTRFALFRTDSYDTRIYSYEYDVLYAFSIPSYYYHGNRVYLLAKYSPHDNIDIWFRIARTYYNNRDVVSSSLSQIDAPHKTDVKLQVRFKF
ncbi:MAG: helix-hairpin-helix domain-containing protein [Bacteroidota bacterium]|nr:helix-hairpin-helix domain-containing protein [Bacteroidota bacterium]